MVAPVIAFNNNHGNPINDSTQYAENIFIGVPHSPIKPTIDETPPVYLPNTNTSVIVHVGGGVGEIATQPPIKIVKPIRQDIVANILQTEIPIKVQTSTIAEIHATAIHIPDVIETPGTGTNNTTTTTATKPIEPNYKKWFGLAAVVIAVIVLIRIFK